MELSERLGREPTAAAVDGSASFGEVKNRVHSAVIAVLGPRLSQRVIDPDALRSRVMATIRAELETEQGIARGDRERLVTVITDEVLGHGPLERLLSDPAISEIMVNGHADIWIERNGRLERSNVRFADDSHVRRIINKMVATVGRRIDEASPMVDARL